MKTIFLILVSATLFVGCAGESEVAPPKEELVVVVNKTTLHTNGATMVHVSMTNNLPMSILVGVNAAVEHQSSGLVTNYGCNPMIHGHTGGMSVYSNVSMEPGQGFDAVLSPVRVKEPFQLHFCSFMSREGVEGMVDEAGNKVKSLKTGIDHESYLGGTFYQLSPLIEPATQPEEE